MNDNKELKDNYLVEKSNVLAKMKSDSYGVDELKLLDVYLARINARDSESRTAVFTKEEFEKVFGMTRVRTQTLQLTTQSMLEKVITLPIGADGAYEQVVLFSYASCKKNEDSGKWEVSLACSPEAKEYFFNVEKVGYIKYKLSNVVNFKRKYSFYLYNLLLANEVQKVFRIGLEELKNRLCVPNDSDYYSDTRRFTEKVINPAIDDINENTDIRCTYRGLRINNRKINFMEFSVVRKDAAAYIPGRDSVEYESVSMDTAAEREENLKYYSIAVDHSLSNADVEILYNICCERFNIHSEIAGRIIKDESIYNLIRNAYLYTVSKVDAKNPAAYMKKLCKDADFGVTPKPSPADFKNNTVDSMDKENMFVPFFEQEDSPLFTEPEILTDSNIISRLSDEMGGILPTNMLELGYKDFMDELETKTTVLSMNQRFDMIMDGFHTAVENVGQLKNNSPEKLASYVRKLYLIMMLEIHNKFDEME